MYELIINTEGNLVYFSRYGQTKEIPLFINGVFLFNWKLIKSINSFDILELSRFIGDVEKKHYIYSGYGLINKNLAISSLANFKYDGDTITIYLNVEEYNEITNNQ